MASSGGKMIYIRQADVPFWTRAEEDARRRGIGISVLLGDLIREHVYRTGSGQKPQKTADELGEEIARLFEQWNKAREAEPVEVES